MIRWGKPERNPAAQQFIRVYYPFSRKHGRHSRGAAQLISCSAARRRGRSRCGHRESGRIYRDGACCNCGRSRFAGHHHQFDELRLTGFIEGQNLSVVPNGFGVHNDRLTEQAVAVVDAMPEVILVSAAGYLRAHQTDVPARCRSSNADDTVGAVVRRWRGRAATTPELLLSPELNGKWLGAAKEVRAPRRLAAISDSAVLRENPFRGVANAAPTRGVELIDLGVGEIERIVAAIDAAKVG